MLQARFKLYDSDIDPQQRENILELRKLLREKGYPLFQPRIEWRRHHELDFIAVTNRSLRAGGEPMLIYPGSNGTIILRGWSGTAQRYHLDRIKNIIHKKYIDRFKIKIGRRPFNRKAEGWEHYLSPEDMEEARRLGFSV